MIGTKSVKYKFPNNFRSRSFAMKLAETYKIKIEFSDDHKFIYIYYNSITAVDDEKILEKPLDKS